MDEAIFEEFKGTGNMELRLDRRLAERRIYPAIDVDASSTRHEELLFDRKQLQMVWKLRRVLSGLAADGNAAPGLELLIDRLKTFRTNDEFLNEIAKQAVDVRPGRSRTAWRRYTRSIRSGGAIAMKTDIHPTYAETVVRVLVRQHLHHPLHQGRRAAHRALQRVPPVLHRQAEAGRLRWPRRALQQALRRPQAGQVIRPPASAGVTDVDQRPAQPAAQRQAAGARP